MKLRAQIPALLIPLIVIPLLVLGWIAYNQLRNASEQRVFGEMRSSMEKLVVHLNTELKTASANIELFAKNILVKKYVLTNDEEQRYSLVMPPLLRLFESYQEAFPDYYEIRIFLPSGYEDVRQTSSYIDNKTDEEGDNPVFRELTRSRDPSYTNIFRNPDNGEISLFVGKPLILRDESVDPLRLPPKLRGYLALTVELQHLISQINKTTIGKEGYLFATDATGNVLFSSDTVRLNEKISQNLLETVSGLDFFNRPTSLSFNGRKSFLAQTELHSDFHLFAVMPEDELVAISQKLAAVVAGITFFAILVTMVCLFIALEYLVVKPIHQLSRLSRKIGRGEWAVQSGVRSTNEIGDLATSFEDMANSLQRSNEQVRHLAYHDSLTGLPNRALFDEYLAHAITRARRDQERLAVLFLDIDDFKRINDTLGHQYGDALLEKVADRLSKCLRESDYIAIADKPIEANGFLARQGGDEFIILLSDLKNINDPSVVAQRIIDTLAHPISIKGHDCYTGASIGITLYPEDGEQSDILIKNADNAMYHVKNQGKNGYQHYKESMNKSAQHSLVLEAKLRKALEKGQLSLNYQSQVSVVDNNVAGLEALLRWHDPEDGMISPGSFIPVAEQTGLIIPIGRWVLQEACRQGVAWRNEGHPPVRISINVSTVQFTREDFTNDIQLALAESEFDPAYLEIEITESTIMANPVSAVEVLDNIKALGVSVALDDFGKGYSSLNYLRRFPIDTLKIDRSFIMEIDKSPEDEEIVAAIVALAHTLKLRVVAEGVETEEQMRLVTEKNCDLVQGFLFSRPVSPDQVFLRASKPRLKAV